MRRANAIAYDVREKGRPKREGDRIDGRILKDEKGENIMVPGTLKGVKALGWYIEEYGIAQISMNLTNISETPVHVAFEEVCRKAEMRGVRVTGSELVGLIPLRSLLEAGRYYLNRQQRSTGVPDEELVRIAARSLGLSDISPFKPHEKIIEYVMAEKGNPKLADTSLRAFMNKTASESPAPGGGSSSAYIGALGAALGTMVANLSSHKRGWDDRWKEFSDLADKGKEIQNNLLRLVDEDTEAFNSILEAFSLPRRTEDEKVIREVSVQKATKNAMLVPFRVMETAFSGFELIRKMVEEGNPSSITDAGVGALALRTCIKGAFLNVRINASGLRDKDFAQELIRAGAELELKSEMEEAYLLKKIDDFIKSQN